MTRFNLHGRTAIVTGAASGLGRAEALALARQGANLVLTDIADASETAQEIKGLGVDARVIKGDIGDWGLAAELVDTAVAEFGRLDIVVNNAGITRDAMIFNMTEEQWDEVVRIHLKGHAALTRAATAFWREQSKESGGSVNARIINTASEAAITGNPGQPNYSAAKAGIVALTTATARSVGKYGVTVNAISPRGRTNMTAGVFTDVPSTNDPLDPDHVARLVAYLASDEASDITGRNFVVYGRMVAAVAPPQIEATFLASGTEFSLDELHQELADLDRSPINQSLSAQLQQLQESAGM